uniref:Uncharacterized protein n=1 Tax=Mangrovactinospora gilvigrisea TaxID=1428644 RepID=A0A1J7BWZ3_9ACTN|nr:hypothetical protein [Mangrovactinospora gilvigrisea]OIV37993.1 hypothetical protein BIV57_08125 [Mangrovactinospora gilvigrisea]
MRQRQDQREWLHQLSDINAGARDELRGLLRPLLLLVGLVAVVLLLAVGGSALAARGMASMHSRQAAAATASPTASAQPTASASAHPPAAAQQAAWRDQVRAFLTAAGGSGSAWLAYLPAATDPTSTFAYTARHDTDPGVRSAGGEAKVSDPALLAAAPARRLRTALSLDGTVDAATLRATAATGTAEHFTLRFTVTARDGSTLAGIAEGRMRAGAAHATLTRLVYPATG